jgi:phenylalanyl-tRNA synthetase beta chain
LRIEAEDPRATPVLLANPLSEEQSAMRTTLLGSLLDVAARNTARGATDLALFESTRVYLQEPSTGLKGADIDRNRPVEPLAGRFAGDQPAPFAEPHRFAGIAIGALSGRSWRGGGEAADFFALKGVLEALGRQLGSELEFAPSEEPFLHPGRAAAVSIGGTPAGWLGEVHPLVCRIWDLEAAVAFELDAAPLIAAATLGEEGYEEVTEFPAVRQDLAVVVPEEVPASKVEEAIESAAGEYLFSIDVFDVYRGEQLAPGSKSLAMNLEFCASNRTLTDDEVARMREAIKAKLAEIGGALRE